MMMILLVPSKSKPLLPLVLMSNLKSYQQQQLLLLLPPILLIYDDAVSALCKSFNMRIYQKGAFFCTDETVLCYGMLSLSLCVLNFFEKMKTPNIVGNVLVPNIE